jgi:cytochrome c peroxidase
LASPARRSTWIRFRSGDESALSEGARRGWALFSGKAGCTNCHDGLLLTDLQYHNVGIGWNFKTPTLNEVANSAPYFHDGSVATLEEAVDLMLGGGIKNPYLDSANLEPRSLTADERADLLAFLRALSANYTVAAPPLPQ